MLIILRGQRVKAWKNASYRVAVVFGFESECLNIVRAF